MHIKKLIAKLLFLLIPFAIIGIILEIKLADIPNSFNKKRTFFERKLDSIRVLCLGSSHSAYGINPLYFSENGFNLANTSQSLFQDKEFVSRYLGKMKSLKLIIIPISYFSLYSIQTEGSEEWRDPYYKLFWNFGYRQHPIDLRYYSYTAMYGNEEILQIVKKGFKEDLAKDLSPLGYLKYDSINTDLIITAAKGQERVKLHESGFKKSHIPENKGYLEYMIKQAQASGVRVVLLTTPLYKTYYENEQPEYLAIMQKVIADLCARYKISYYDYSRDARFTLPEFHDNDHLNVVGAKHFSQIIDCEIIQPTFH